MKDCVVGLDLGGTKTLCLIVNSAGKILSRVKAKTKTEGKPAQLVQSLLETIRQALASAGAQEADLRAVGIGVPSPVDFARGIVLATPNLGIRELPLRDALRKELPVPVAVENDVNAGTYAEYSLGAAKGYRHVIGVFPGTGIGGGLVLDGRIYRGATGGAGEVGHMIIQMEGRPCGCGRYGCLEAHASRTALAKDLLSLAATGRSPTLAKKGGTDLLAMRSGVIAKAVENGDKEVQRLVKRTAWFLGIGLANCVNLFNPEVIVLGGGLVEKLKGFYKDEAERSMRAHAMEHLVRDVKVLEASLGDDAVALGAAILAREAAEQGA